MVRIAPLAFVLAACGGPAPIYPPATGSLVAPPEEGGGGANPGPGGDVDSDGDGLTDAEERALGSDPDAVDSDGDGWQDGEEVDGNTDPVDASDHPYAGGWPIDPCRDDLVASGHGVGQVAQDFALLDQHGETVRLHDFCGKEVLLVSSAMWCGPCQGEAPDLQALYARYADQGLIVITLLGEDLYGAAPSQQDLQVWANTFGVEHPVLADAGWQVTGRFITGNSIALPTMHLLGDGAVVLVRDGWVSESTVANNLP